MYFPELEMQKFHVTVSHEPNVRLHGHEFLELSYVWQGKIEHLFDGKKTPVGENEYFIVDYGIQHSYRSIGKKPLRVVNFLFYPEFIDRTLSGYRSLDRVLSSFSIRFSYKSLSVSPNGTAFADRDGRIRELIGGILDEYAAARYGAAEYIRSLLLQVLILTLRKISPPAPPRHMSDIVRRITEIAKVRYREKLYLRDLAVQYGYSLAHLSKKFKAETGMNFSEYLQNIRIENSLRLLEETDDRVSDIAAAVGYEDVKFFHRVFRETLRLSPREFRKLHR